MNPACTKWEKGNKKIVCSFFLLFPGVASWTLSLTILNASATVASGLNWLSIEGKFIISDNNYISLHR